MTLATAVPALILCRRGRLDRLTGKAFNTMVSKMWRAAPTASTIAPWNYVVVDGCRCPPQSVTKGVPAARPIQNRSMSPDFPGGPAHLVRTEPTGTYNVRVSNNANDIYAWIS